MAFGELVALREQIAHEQEKQQKSETSYDPKDCSLANAIRALRKCMRNLGKYVDDTEDLLNRLIHAQVQKYNNRTDKKARYRPKNPDKRPLGKPTIRKLTHEERKKLIEVNQRIAA